MGKSDLVTLVLFLLLWTSGSHTPARLFLPYFYHDTRLSSLETLISVYSSICSVLNFELFLYPLQTQNIVVCDVMDDASS